MTALGDLHVRGNSAKLPVLNPAMTSDDGELLLAQYVRHFADPDERLKKIIEHIRGNLASFYSGPAL